MPSSPNYKRNYKQEQKTAKKRGETKDRAKRNAARRKLAKAGAVKKGDGKDVDHKNGIKAGNSRSNLRVQSPKTNRSAGGKKGSTAGKAAGGRKGKAKKKATTTVGKILKGKHGASIIAKVAKTVKKKATTAKGGARNTGKRVKF